MSSYHHLSLFPMAISLVLVIVALLILPVDAQNNFQVKLRHVDSGANLTKFELLQRALKRDEKRLKSLYPMALSKSHQSIESPIHAGDAVFLMDLSIGTPPQPYSAMLDTATDLIWIQCRPCKRCYRHRDPIFDPKKSSSFSNLTCLDNLCKTIGCSKSDKSCGYWYNYDDYSWTHGFLANETFGFGKVSVRKIGFGCGNDNAHAEGYDPGDGVVGLGRGALSLVSQLNVTTFSYCLPSFDSNETGTLLMAGSFACGKTTDQGGSIEKSTPLLKNPKYTTYYYLSLEGISFGDTKLSFNKSTFAIKRDGSGVMRIDSSITRTYIQESVYHLFKNEIIKLVKLPVVDIGIDMLCFKLTHKSRKLIFPTLTFHFERVDLDLPEENYIIRNSSIACLAIRGYKWMSILGTFQQQNIKVVHDLKSETVTFVHGKCDQL